MSTGNAYGATSKTFGGGFPVWVEILGKFQAGGKVVNLPAAGDIIAAGAPVEINTEDHTAKVLNFFKVHTNVGSGDTELKVVVLDGLPRLKAGNFIMTPPATATGTGTAITVGTVTQGTEYDTVTIVANSLGTLTAGDLLVEAAATGASKQMYAIPNALVHNDVYVDAATTYATVSAVYSGKVYAKRTPFMSTAVKSSLAQIVFDNSY
jgi:hypothetical protein